MNCYTVLSVFYLLPALDHDH